MALHAVLMVAPEVPSPPGAGVRLEWVATAGCPAAARGAEHLERFLGDRTPTAAVRVELAANVAGYVATVTVDGAARTLQASDCETLARAAALVVAVSLDPVAAAELVLPGESEPAPEPELEPVEPEPELDVVVTEPERGPRVEGRRARSPRSVSTRADMPPRTEPRSTPAEPAHWLGVGGGLALALVPALTGNVRLGYAFERGVLRIQADATYATPRAITYPAEPDVGGRFQSAVLGARACFAPAARRFALPLCGGLEGGTVLGRGLGVTNTRRPVGVWVGGLASATARVRVGPRVALTAGADLVLSLRRPAFHVGTRETLFRSPPVGLRALVGLELRLR
jgi:hypothetical protein